ncbi:MAG: short-chain dehydrogenase/reductase [Ilumatobacteraceae bacterium]|nr:short-chain dehydrogenase/reductase [Ilumatobacteraceae bacterium]
MTAGDRLANRVAVITGGASGIGKATVLRFLAEGARVVVGDLNVEAGRALAAEVGDDAVLRVQTTDVSDEQQVAALIDTATTAFGLLDVLLNNAGIGGAFGPLTELDVDHWDRTFAVLTRSVFLGIKHGARAMLAQGGGGSIINTASVAGARGGGGPLAYSAATAAGLRLTENASNELAPHRIRVNAICPGFIRTPLAVGRDAETVVARISEVQPWPETGAAEDIAAACLFLASDDAQFVNGIALPVDGGLLATGTRLNGLVDARNSWNRYSGFAHGSTGIKPEVRSLSGGA